MGGRLISLAESSILKRIPRQSQCEEHRGANWRLEHLIWDNVCASVAPKTRSVVFKCILKRYKTLPGLKCLSTWLSENQSFAQTISKIEKRIAARLVQITAESNEDRRFSENSGVFWFFTNRLMNVTSRDAESNEHKSYRKMMCPMWNVWSEMESSRSSGTDVNPLPDRNATKQEPKASLIIPTTSDSGNSIPSKKMEA